jgi:hypothetical protein
MKIYNLIVLKKGLAEVFSHATALGASNHAQSLMDARDKASDEQLHIRLEETDLED